MYTSTVIRGYQIYELIGQLSWFVGKLVNTNSGLHVKINDSIGFSCIK